MVDLPWDARLTSERREFNGLGIVRLAQHSRAEACESLLNFCVLGPMNGISECFRRIRVEDARRLGFFHRRLFERPLNQAQPIYRAITEITGDTL